MVSLRRAAMLSDEQFPKNGMHSWEVDSGSPGPGGTQTPGRYLAEVEQERVRIRFVSDFRLRFCK